LPAEAPALALLPLTHVHSLAVLGTGVGVVPPPPEFPPQPARQSEKKRAKRIDWIFIIDLPHLDGFGETCCDSSPWELKQGGQVRLLEFLVSITRDRITP
jgi:hypothetical protein